jgi:hypothetical protein
MFGASRRSLESPTMLQRPLYDLSEHGYQKVILKKEPNKKVKSVRRPILHWACSRVRVVWLRHVGGRNILQGHRLGAGGRPSSALTVTDAGLLRRFLSTPSDCTKRLLLGLNGFPTKINSPAAGVQCHRAGKRFKMSNRKPKNVGLVLPTPLPSHMTHHDTGTIWDIPGPMITQRNVGSSWHASVGGRNVLLQGHSPALPVRAGGGLHHHSHGVKFHPLTTTG